jgi:hypothetical protein
MQRGETWGGGGISDYRGVRFEQNIIRARRKAGRVGLLRVHLNIVMAVK